MLTERLLQFIWQFQYFNNKHLATAKGDAITIIYPGLYNTNQGPDFLQAKVKIGNTLWAGNVELHLKASDWLLHKHTADANYKNIILHVVWINDTNITDYAGNEMHTLEMQPLVSRLMLEKYHGLMLAQGFVPCEKQLPVLSPITWDSWKERLLAERLQKRTTLILQAFEQCNNHWEEVFWRLLAKNFGIPVNTALFEEVATSISINILAKHKSGIHQLEALLLGQAGLLNTTFTDDYPRLLQREYLFLQNKYNLRPTTVQPLFLRMRPANFPTIRLAQLAMLVHTSEHLFSRIKEAALCSDVAALLNVTANDYWHYHYRPDEATPYNPKTLGQQMIDNIIINTVVPVVFAYGVYMKQQLYKDKALDWLLQLAPEQNNITRQWKQHGVYNKSAMHSQALLELKKHYCNEKRCLDCAVGNRLLREQ